MNKVKTDTLSTGLVGQKMTDYSMLVKLRLNLTVVFSSVLAYLIAVEGSVDYFLILVLALGGFLVTGAANALNQVLEKDYDKMMQRTRNRPLAAERMTSSEAVMAAGIMSVIGITLLATINPWAAFLGTIALISYSFLYTPLKRVGPIAVFVGAIPGALPLMIGVVAAQGHISSLAIALFSLQFIWQLPHFWAIGWLAFEDYQQAGFKLLEGKDKLLGKQSMLFGLLLIPIVWMPYFLGTTQLISAVLCTMASIVYAGFAWNLYKKNTRKSALQLMFSSFFYLPFVLFCLYADKII